MFTCEVAREQYKHKYSFVASILEELEEAVKDGEPFFKVPVLKSVAEKVASILRSAPYKFEVEIEPKSNPEWSSWVGLKISGWAD